MDYLFYKVIKPDGSVGLLTNSAGKIVRLLKGFVNYQIDKGVIPPIDLKHFKVVEEETDAIYLSEKELSTIHELDLSDDKQLEEIRDVFITGCFTGLRYSDLSTLSPEHIDLDNEIINLKQRKVHKAVIIPMIDYVPEILKKYNYDLPKIPRYIFNERVKELGRRAKLKQKIESGEIPKPQSSQTNDSECCGMHEICERESLLAAVSKDIEYYNDEELDVFKGRHSDSYSTAEIAEFGEVLYTLRSEEVAGWVRSLQLREIELPDPLKDEVLLIVGERREKS